MKIVVCTSSFPPVVCKTLHFITSSPLPMADSSSPDALTFEQALQRLEHIVESLEDETPALEQALDAYEEGTTLARLCLDRLDAAELRVNELSLDDQ